MQKDNRGGIPEKGEFQYLDKKKKKQLIISAFSMLMVVIICLTGIIMYHTQKSIFAVMAALAALPAAKMLVGYIVIMPYISVGKDTKDEVEKVCGNRENCRIIYDVILSSSDKAMYAGVVFVKNGRIYGYTEQYTKNADKKNTYKNHKDTNKSSDKNKITLADIEKHIKFILDANCNYSVIKMFDDKQRFLKAVEAEGNLEAGMSDGEISKMRSMNERIEKRLKVYIF